MCNQHGLCLRQSVDGWKNGANTRVIEKGSSRWVQWTVNVDANQDGLAFDVDVVQSEDVRH